MIRVSYSIYIGNHPEGKDHWSDDSLSLAAHIAWQHDREDLAHRILRGFRKPRRDNFFSTSWYAIPSKKRLLAWWKTTMEYEEYEEYQQYKR